MNATPDLQVLPAQPPPQTRRGLAYCQLDRWAFDPRYTDGRCPLCGWEPADTPRAPASMAALRRLDWEIIGLFALIVVALVLGAVVAHAAGLLPALSLR